MKRGHRTSYDEVSQAHPELPVATAERVSDAFRGVAEGYGTDVKTVAADSRRAEQSSLAGNDISA